MASAELASVAVRVVATIDAEADHLVAHLVRGTNSAIGTGDRAFTELLAADFGRKLTVPVVDTFDAATLIAIGSLEAEIEALAAARTATAKSSRFVTNGLGRWAHRRFVAGRDAASRRQRVLPHTSAARRW